MNLKLTIELVPSTTWYNNIRKVLTQSQWNKIRKQAISESNNKCFICGSVPKSLDCHELWEYDEVNKIQTLKGFIALCKSCHLVKHIGMAGILAAQGQIDIENIIQHFMVVNNCSREVFEKHKQEAFQEWNKRSRTKWKVDFGRYKEIIPEEMLNHEWII
jgi:hypothetical protein